MSSQLSLNREGNTTAINFSYLTQNVDYINEIN